MVESNIQFYFQEFCPKHKRVMWQVWKHCAVYKSYNNQGAGSDNGRGADMTRSIHVGHCIRCKSVREYRLEKELSLAFRNASMCPVCKDNLFWFLKRVFGDVVIIAEEEPI